MPITKITREDLIRTAAELFREQGYHKTTMEEIGRACGIQKGSFYHHFPSKKKMMSEVLKAYARTFREQAHKLAYDKKMPQRKRITAILDVSETIFPGTNGCLMANIILEAANAVPEFTPVIKEFFDSWIAAFEHIFRENYSAERAREMAELSVGEIEGAMILMRLHKDRKYVVKAAKNILSRVEG
jgi:AcrR family transcriptional regulator